jgi:hypothetical protein
MDLNQLPSNQEGLGWQNMPKEEFDKEFPSNDKDIKNQDKRKQSRRAT